LKSAGLSTPLLEREMGSILQKKPLHFKEMYGLKFCLIILLASHARNNELKFFIKIKDFYSNDKIIYIAVNVACKGTLFVMWQYTVTLL
jgi:hypothetical protein